MGAKDHFDLWTTKLPAARLHPFFRSLAACPVDRACFQRWADGFPDVNGNAAHEFQTKFSPMFWEIYLFKMFQTLGFDVARPKDRPDFVLQTSQGPVAAEAKVIDTGQGQSPVWTPINEVSWDRESFYAQTCAKLSGALRDKLQHLRSYGDEPHVKDRPFLLCVNPYDTPHFIMQGFGAMTRVLFQYCDPIIAENSSGDWEEVGHRRVESFVTRSGSVVPFGFFLDPSNTEVSAVFFNPRATFSKLLADPLREGHEKERVYATWYMVATGELCKQEAHPSNYRETLADGGYLFLNAYAKHPIDPEPFFKEGVAVSSFDDRTRTLTTRTPTPFLKERVTYRVLPEDFPKDLMTRGKAAYAAE